ncbi:polysaccharide deacetylase family protein [Anaerocolumna sp. AGMB13025]|uniref:polysaccharide deacetylase family protein n=1 Tax=Anaerocolumna sp. AGMB13025 TaxID=3039116 RepID=UPI00241DDC4A|nr:polysaccharide deacetylase family protein [Anaerocolumna sp. AGMB13025]WFR55457.1 polysaccharide deacetylase family protein [Anaerocolumna sp. AGMB13025]
MEIHFLYPNSKTKALTLSYDDGQIYDRRLVDILNKYGMKGTFHLNSGLLDQEGFVTAKEIKELYRGHEIACHGVRHNYLHHLPKELLMHELWDDRKRLEELAESIVVGMSYAFGEYSGEVVDCLSQIGISYARTVNSNNRFSIPVDFLRWEPTCHHNGGLLDKAEKFLNIPGYMKLPLFYIWGHSFEFERENNWDLIENFCKTVSNQEDVWYVTNLDYYNYIMAMKRLVFSLDSTLVYNPSGLAVWFMCGEKVVTVQPGETKRLEASL